LGRGVARRPLGPVAVGLAGALSAVRDGIELDKVIITLALYGTVWGFGLVVRGRAARAHAAAARVARLAGQDPTVTGALLAIEERGRLGAQAVLALRSAIVGMRDTARRAARDLDPSLVREVHERGALAVDELRELLGLLREPAVPRGPESPAPGDRAGRWARSTLLLPLACLALAALSMVIATTPPVAPESLLPGACAYALAAWAVAARPSRAAWASLGVLMAAGVLLSTAYGPRGAGFVIFVIGASALAGLAWNEGDRILHEARHRAGQLQA